MAVLVECFSVIIKADIIKKKYPGGLPGFLSSAPNKTVCTDDELVRVGFMMPVDLQKFIGTLERHDITYMQNGHPVDLVVADQINGLAVPCEWAEFSTVALDPERTKMVCACRLTGSTNRYVAFPDGWEFDNSIRYQPAPADGDAEPKHLKFIRQDGNVEVYQDVNTGKEIYVGRTAEKKNCLVTFKHKADNDPVQLEACRAYARMINNLDPSHIEPWLAENLTYSSQWVFTDISGKDAYMEYVRGKMDTCKRSGKKLKAEIAYTDVFGAGHCVIVNQGSVSTEATLLVKMVAGKIISMTMCGIPSPQECRRTGEFPS